MIDDDGDDDDDDDDNVKRIQLIKLQELRGTI